MAVGPAEQREMVDFLLSELMRHRAFAELRDQGLARVIPAIDGIHTTDPFDWSQIVIDVDERHVSSAVYDAIGQVLERIKKTPPNIPGRFNIYTYRSKFCTRWCCQQPKRLWDIHCQYCGRSLGQEASAYSPSPGTCHQCRDDYSL